MINYECQNCNEPFSAEEPPFDGRELCDECRAEFKQTATHTHNVDIHYRNTKVTL